MTATRILIVSFFALIALGFATSCGGNYDAYDHQACLNLGVQYGTPEYVNCRVGAANLREQRRAHSIRLWNAINRPAYQQPKPSVTCHTVANTTRCW